ncbi:4-hydroxythreonine-4-phosphate dehydrogenase PdxA [Desulfogranum mediterraneum]|uniref:4-hydroxythreonine-4-phosphate dehydrogenase PdxA n=1 Tax=Desulfogranum mediterraneum TaxID=160661 RepID=UPI0004129871|nr:4-hydroxythreonine-4-phosphate dehydrogenase PdxA [Desulfogranum mediterraneum]
MNPAVAHHASLVGAPLLISMGCPVGIGPEIVLRYFSTSPSEGRLPAVVVGDPEILAGVAAERQLSLEVVEWSPGGALPEASIPVYPVSRLGYAPQAWGKPDARTGQAMARYIEEAVALIQGGQGSGLVTCPISKYSLNRAGYPYPGHTEMLAALTGSQRYRMMMAGTRLRVVLVTIHEALERVPALLTVEGVAACITQTVDALKRDFGIRQPRVAVAALNPHGGEEGMFGDQEALVIKPAVEQCRSLAEVSGPWPPDTVFYQAAAGHFDAVVAMYHDQGLIPFKLLHFADGVNVTLGLPLVRTSVDHGTAYDIAGSWQASASSLEAAISLAGSIVCHRSGGRRDE